MFTSSSNSPPPSPLPQPLSSIPPPTQITTPLPQGQCRFVHHRGRTAPTDGPQRCFCTGFRLSQTSPDSRCECGHQTWCHERNMFSSDSATVPVEEYQRVLTKVQELEEQLIKERDDREEAIQNVFRSIQGVHAILAHVSHQNGLRFTAFDDKIESVMDTAHGCQDRLDMAESRLTSIDDETIELHTRVERLEEQSDLAKVPLPSKLAMANSPPLQPVSPQTRASRLSVFKPSDDPMLDVSGMDLDLDMAWAAEVIFVLSSQQGRPFPRNTIPYYRCRSRNLVANLNFENGTRECFVSTIEHAFAHVLHGGRRWTPMLSHSIPLGDTSELILNPLPGGKDSPGYWSYDFLDRYCMAGTDRAADTLYIALLDEDLTWADVRALPHGADTDDTCWQYAPELDHQHQRTVLRGRDRVRDSAAPSELDLNLDLDLIAAGGPLAPPPYSSKRPSRVPAGMLMRETTSSDFDRASVRSIPVSIASQTSGGAGGTRDSSGGSHRPDGTTEESQYEESDRALKKQRLPLEPALEAGAQMHLAVRPKRKVTGPYQHRNPPSTSTLDSIATSSVFSQPRPGSSASSITALPTPTPSTSSSHHGSRFMAPMQSFLHRHHGDHESTTPTPLNVAPDVDVSPTKVSPTKMQQQYSYTGATAMSTNFPNDSVATFDSTVSTASNATTGSTGTSGFGKIGIGKSNSSASTHSLDKRSSGSTSGKAKEKEKASGSSSRGFVPKLKGRAQTDEEVRAKLMNVL